MEENLYTLTPPHIIMYSTEYCPDCKLAKAYFEANEIAYQQVNLEGNEEATEFVKQINRGFQSVPTIIFPDGSILVEPSLTELRKKFSNS